MVKTVVTEYGDRIQVRALKDGDIRLYIYEVTEFGEIFEVDLTLDDSAALRRALFSAEWDGK